MDTVVGRSSSLRYVVDRRTTLRFFRRHSGVRELWLMSRAVSGPQARMGAEKKKQALEKESDEHSLDSIRGIQSAFTMQAFCKIITAIVNRQHQHFEDTTPTTLRPCRPSLPQR